MGLTVRLLVVYLHHWFTWHSFQANNSSLICGTTAGQNWLLMTVWSSVCALCHPHSSSWSCRVPYGVPYGVPWVLRRCSCYGRATIPQPAVGLLSQVNKTGAEGDSSRLVRLCDIAEETRIVKFSTQLCARWLHDSTQPVGSPSSWRSRCRSARPDLTSTSFPILRWWFTRHPSRLLS